MALQPIEAFMRDSERRAAWRTARTGFAALVMLGGALIPALTAHANEAFTDQRQMGTKYSPLKQIDAGNVQGLQLAWEYHTGETSHDSRVLDAFEDEPSLIDGNLVICSTSRRLIALDPASGRQRWIYDPKAKATGMRKCRGISAWTDEAAPAGAMCRTRIFLGTADYRLVAVDAKTGKACPDFGDRGEVQMHPTKDEIMVGEVSANSRPAVVNGVVVVGSTVADDQRLDAPSGRVLAFDARSGAPKWQWDPIPRDPADPAMATWPKGTEHIGSGNVWAEMAVDEKLDLVYLPTSSPSVDFYGAARPGNNEYADSIVALKGSTGQVVWHFQFTHHNLWDYDTPSQPLLIDLPYNGKTVPALVQNLKTGMIFVFNRATGEPLFPYVERPVPQTGAAPGEWLSPTQPFPIGMPALSKWSLEPENAWGFTPVDRWLCKKRIAELDHGPIYTPPSLKGAVLFPGAAGGADWGGGAFDPATNLMVVPTNRVAMVVTLVPRETAPYKKDQAIETGKPMYFPNAGVPYMTKMEPLLSPLGTPCTAPPWAALTAVDMVTGQIRWEVPLGSIEKLAHLPFSWELGTPGAGGPLVTAGGLVFIGYTLDDQFRAFDLKTGKTLWKTDLPAAGMATPMSYEVNGEQYVVMPAGGHSMYGTSKSDAVVAYKLKH
ncbi:MAG: pyrroloquinoline quinone-dependent dehydrogenase [Solimonas sp.]